MIVGGIHVYINVLVVEETSLHINVNVVGINSPSATFSLSWVSNVFVCHFYTTLITQTATYKKGNA